MSIVHDMSDEGIARQFGDIVHELPELYQALRTFQMQNRPTAVSGGFKMKADWVSVQGGGGGVLRVKVGNPRSMK